MFRTLVISIDADDKPVAPAHPRPANDRAVRRLAILRRLQAGHISAEQAADLLAELERTQDGSRG
jgi:hypothetical protein